MVNTATNKDIPKKVCPICKKPKSISTGYYKTSSPLFTDTGCVPICISCVKDYIANDDGTINLIKMKTMLQRLDKPYYTDDLNSAYDQYRREHSFLSDDEVAKKGKDIIGLYFKNINSLRQTKNKSYADSEMDGFIHQNSNTPIKEKQNISDRYDANTHRKKNVNNLANSDQYIITEEMIKFWGTGYEDLALQALQGYYDELLKLCDGEPDIKKQKMMKNLCLLEYQMQVNIQNGKDIGTLSNSYKSLFEASGLKNEETNTDGDSFGMWIADIEKYCPAEYYKDKTKYRDFFGIGEYIQRFLFRPLKNLLTGSKDKEQEFWIDDKDGD